jgi:hypothetical protein
MKLGNRAGCGDGIERVLPSVARPKSRRNQRLIAFFPQFCVPLSLLRCSNGGRFAGHHRRPGNHGIAKISNPLTMGATLALPAADAKKGGPNLEPPSDAFRSKQPERCRFA